MRVFGAFHTVSTPIQLELQNFFQNFIDALRRWRSEVVKHFIVRQYRIASASQPRASRRSASMKFEQNCTILAVAPRRPCETHRKCAHVFETLFVIVLPSFTSNDTPSRSIASYLVFDIFERGPELQNFPALRFFWTFDESLLKNQL